MPALVVILSSFLVKNTTRATNGGASHHMQEGEYYLYPVSIELEGRNPNGGAWDSIGNSAPDPFVTIDWKGQEIFRSSTKTDTLLAHWSIAELNLAKIAVAGGKTSVDDSIRAARVRFSKDGAVTVKIWDDDITMNDFIGEFQVQFSELVPGENSITPSLPGVTRIVLNVVDIRSAPDLLK